MRSWQLGGSTPSALTWCRKRITVPMRVWPIRKEPQMSTMVTTWWRYLGGGWGIRWARHTAFCAAETYMTRKSLFWASASL